MELAELQDREVGDGTTSVVIIAAELLKVSIPSLQSHFMLTAEHHHKGAFFPASI